jgi:hypothetical protein
MTDAWVLAAAAALVTAGFQEEQPEAGDTAAPTPPTLALEAPPQQPDVLRQTAGTYAAYHEDVNEAGRRELRSGADLDATMDELAQYYDGDRLVDAQIAYAALVAAQHPEFIDAVRAVADYYGEGVARAALMNDPVYVTGFVGADVAQESVFGAINEDVASIRTVGTRYRQAAYELQHETWAGRRARDRESRLEALETAADRLEVNFSLAEPAPGTDVSAPMGSASAMFAERAPTAAPALPDLQVNVGEAQMEPDERRIGQMLAVAALQSIEDGDMSALDRMLDDPAVERCITWARLTMAQCVAAGHFKYEDSFCIAEHALNDVADCLTATRPVSN